jgi:hypothetical protein
MEVNPSTGGVAEALQRRITKTRSTTEKITEQRVEAGVIIIIEDIGRGSKEKCGRRWWD